MPLDRNISNELSEEINDVIFAVPSWLLRRGIIVIFFVLSIIFFSSALIRYPEIIKTTLKVNSLNTPKEVISHQSGKLVKILVNDNQITKAGEPIAFIESTANHVDVLKLSKKLKILYDAVNRNKSKIEYAFLEKGWKLGELQINFQAFYQEYTLFSNTQVGGFYLIQKSFLKRDAHEIKMLEQQILKQKSIQEKELANMQDEYEAYKKLKSKNVISNSEFRQQENKFLSGRYPLEQTGTALLNNRSSFLSKEKELATLENTMKEQKAKFLQALNSFISEIESWKLKFVITSPVNGRATYVGILQENQNVSINQLLFIIDQGNSNFFGEAKIPQYNMGKIEVGQRTIVKLRSYPFEEFGILKGKISIIGDFALKDSVFLAKIDFDGVKGKQTPEAIKLKPGMIADVEIVTRESSLLERLLRNISKIFDHS